MTTDLTNLGPQVLARRQVLKMSVRDVAAQTGVAPATVSRVERGLADPRVSIAKPLLAWLDETASVEFS